MDSPMEIFDRIAQSRLNPAEADVLEHLPMIDALPMEEAAEAFRQLADLYYLKAFELLEAWDFHEKDPAVDLGGIVRQSMTMDLGELMQDAPPPKPRKSRTPAVAPIVRELSQQEAIALASAIDLSHDEDIQGWTEKLLAAREALTVGSLAEQAALPLVCVWLAILLSERFHLERAQDFYANPHNLRVSPAPRKSTQTEQPLG
jgi:hypothetical protein